jgi:hypothetical protein
MTALLRRGWDVTLAKITTMSAAFVLLHIVFAAQRFCLKMARLCSLGLPSCNAAL